MDKIKKEWTTPELQEKQVKRLRERFGVDVNTSTKDRNYFEITRLEPKRAYIYVPYGNFTYDTQEHKVDFVGNDKTVSIKTYNLIMLSKKYNSSDILVPIYFADDYNWFISNNFEEIDNTTLLKFDNALLVGKKFAKPKRLLFVRD